MPQMFPINWLMLTSTTMLVFFLLVNKMFFLLAFKLFNDNNFFSSLYNFKSMKNNKIMNFLWMW